MDQLGPDPSKEAVESEIGFLQMCINTIDADDDQSDYLRSTYQSQIASLEAALTQFHPPAAAPAPPSTPPSQIDSPTSSDSLLASATLPSRTRDPPRPLTHQTSQPAMSTANGDSSLQNAKKRARHSSGFNATTTAARKSQRTSESQTPSPFDGSDFDWPSLPTQPKSTVETNPLKSVQTLQREAEKRRQREKEDEAFARQLQDGVDHASFLPLGSQRYEQSLLGPHPPARQPDPSSAPLDHDTFPNLRDVQAYIKNEPLPSNTPMLRHAPNGSDTNQDNGHHSDSDDLSIITPEQFNASTSKSPRRRALANMQPRYNGMEPSPSTSTFHNPELSFHPSNSNHAFDSPRYDLPGSYPVPKYGTNAMGSVNPGLDYMQPPSQGVPVNGDSSVSKGYENAWNPFAGLDSAGQSMLNNLRHALADFQSVPHAESDSSTPSTSYGQEPRGGFDRSLFDRQLDSIVSDSGKTREEIVQLLENIRPDEEIPTESIERGPSGLLCDLMAHQKVGLKWLKNQEQGTNKGSILADDMGLGKTIQALALMLDHPSQDPAVKATLIIAPVALMRQWAKEIQTKVHPSHQLTIWTYHGGKKNKPYSQLCTYDVVLTTFGTVAAEYKRKHDWDEYKKRNPNMPAPKVRFTLLGDQCRWHRIIVDEAQYIKNKSTKSAQAVSSLVATYRLCMTGTPMMNNVGELYSLIRFLGIPPYNDQTLFNKDFARPLKTSASERSNAMKQLQILLKAILLRRTKTSKINGQPILQLKPRTTEIRHAIFGPEQAELYRGIEEHAQIKFNRYLRANAVMKNYSNILVLLLRLRQACCHPHLIKDLSVPIDGEAAPEEMEELARNLQPDVIRMIKESEGAFECPICYDASDNPTIFFPCGHDVCAECFARMTDPSLAIRNGDDRVVAKCPECRQELNRAKIIRYTIFKKIHQPELAQEEFGSSALGNDEGDDSDSESDEEPEEAQDADSKGNLRGFVVDDDEEEEQDSEPDAQDSAAPKVSMAQQKGKGKKMSKGKAKKETKTLAQLKKEGMRNIAARRKYLKRLRKSWEMSAKIDKAMEILEQIQENDPTEKTIVFSQFTSFLDLFEVPVSDRGWHYRRYDGSMAPKERNEAVEDFMEKANVKLMLVSLKAGNAGLNLNCASQVILLDPFWNPFIEEQAVDRAHRIGQTRDVNVHRILVENTVEDRIIGLQEKKRQLIEKALDEKTGKDISRLGVRQLTYLFVSLFHLLLSRLRCIQAANLFPGPILFSYLEFAE